MLYLSPYALEEGIAALYKPVIKKYDIIIHFIYLMLASVVMFYLGANPLLFIFAAFVLFVYYRHFAIKEFGGITGDIIGAFLELTELVLLMVVLI
jgi:adenosylcobinamide-GDP ribazoletransferase